jgi:signal transduction histidine kinase
MKSPPLTRNRTKTINARGTIAEFSDQEEREQTLDQATALIISDDPEFSRIVRSHWQGEPNAPEFTLMSGDLCRDLDADGFDLAIVGAVRQAVLPSVFNALDPAGKPVLFVCKEKRSAQQAREMLPNLRVLREQEGWVDALVLVASEVVQLGRVLARARRAEEASKSLEQQAALGRYMLDMRHTLNNSLTSVLGNSELLLLERDSLSAGARSQIETIRNMAVRMHEILQRFSSIEKELSVVERQAENEARSNFRVAASGS